MNKLHLYLLAISITLYSCNSNFDSTDIKNGIYHNQELEWKMAIPKDWKSIPRTHRERWTNVTLARYMYQDLRPDFTHLLGIYKGEEDKWNCMISNMESMSFFNRVVSEKELIVYYSQILSKGFGIMKLKEAIITSSIDTINGVNFNRLNIDLVSRKNKPLYSQIIYLKIINDKLLEVILTYDNLEDKSTMLDAFRKSNFASLK
ncbi:MAG: hypothetical protein HRT72_10160 [Flavobacteriales bacterium]|nr:hypothetical protein [Flavobacteriales bacterium]